MAEFSAEGRLKIEEIAARHGFSPDAVATLAQALLIGGGRQAQFSHPEFGGMGQWSSGGMLMIGDMFNNQLKGRIASLADELAALVGQMNFAPSMQSQSQYQSPPGAAPYPGGQMQSGTGSQQQMQGGSIGVQGGYGGTSLFVPGSGSANWWPAELGTAGSVGAQNDLKYAYFPAARRLAILLGGNVTVYDTGDHVIGGFSQQQGGGQSLTFTSQLGTVRVADLPVVRGSAVPSASAAPAPVSEPEPIPQPAAPETKAASETAAPAAPAPAHGTPASPGPADGGSTRSESDEIFYKIEKLAELKAKGLLSEAEFEAKKSALLSRL